VPSSCCRLFTIMCKIVTMQLALQSDIQSLHCWSNENMMSFNKSKCKVLSITRRKSPFIYPYALGDHQLLSSDVKSDLGITISSRLLWNVQINKVRSKANKTARQQRQLRQQSHYPELANTFCLLVIRHHSKLGS
jgi:hypothetical protein